MGEFMGSIIILLLWLAAGSLIPASFLRLAGKWFTQTEMMYGNAYTTILTAPAEGQANRYRLWIGASRYAALRENSEGVDTLRPEDRKGNSIHVAG